MCRVCKDMTGKTPSEALAMLDEMGLPSGRGEDTRVRRLARGESEGHLPHKKNVEAILRRMRDRGVEVVDFTSSAKEAGQ